jgi:hypothetical protein
MFKVTAALPLPLLVILNMLAATTFRWLVIGFGLPVKPLQQLLNRRRWTEDHGCIDTRERKWLVQTQSPVPHLW